MARRVTPDTESDNIIEQAMHTNNNQPGNIADELDKILHPTNTDGFTQSPLTEDELTAIHLYLQTIK